MLLYRTLKKVSKSLSRIRILDSCRGLAALIVVFHHVYTRFHHPSNIPESNVLHSVLRFISECDNEAVLFFFILSGFSIRLSLNKTIPLSKSALHIYLFRRLNRIVPLYIFALAFTTVTGLIRHDLKSPDFSLFNLVGNLLFLQTSKSFNGYWFSPFGNNGPLWSLSFEVFYYIFLPVFIVGMMKIFKAGFFYSRARIYILGVAFLLSLASVIIDKIFFFPCIAFATLFYVFYSGFFLGDLYLNGHPGVIGNLISIAVIALTAFTLQIFFPSASLHRLFVGSLITLTLYLSYIIRSTLASPALQIIESVFNFMFYRTSRGSYALYLLHYPVILIFLHFQIQNLWLVVLAMIVLTVICVFIEEYFVKRKFIVVRASHFT